MRLRGINNRDGHFKLNFNLKLNLSEGAAAPGGPGPAGRPPRGPRTAVHTALRQSRSLAGYYGALCCRVTGGHHAVPLPLEAVPSCSLRVVLGLVSGLPLAVGRRRFPRELEL
jgi:hypothetical protein